MFALSRVQTAQICFKREEYPLTALVVVNGAVPFKNAAGLLSISVNSWCESNSPRWAPLSVGARICNMSLEISFPARVNSVMNRLHSVVFL